MSLLSNRSAAADSLGSYRRDTTRPIAGRSITVSCTLDPGNICRSDQAHAVFFRDRTSGDETYALGRYLDLEDAEDGRYVVDFNRAYNPACAFSPHYNCPLPPEENDLPAAIAAGEMTPR